MDGLALLQSALGVYAMTVYAVSLRIREVGIRMAMGARRGHVLSDTTKKAVNTAQQPTIVRREGEGCCIAA
jgi:hypothetical protein